jgi:hypothetical protein
MQVLYRWECGFKFWVDTSMEGGESSLFEDIILSLAGDNEKTCERCQDSRQCYRDLDWSFSLYVISLHEPFLLDTVIM